MISTSNKEGCLLRRKHALDILHVALLERRNAYWGIFTCTGDISSRVR